MRHGLPRRTRCLRRRWQCTAATHRIGGTRSPALWVMGGKTAEEEKRRFDLLIEDVLRIEAGQMPRANYRSSTEEVYSFQLFDAI